MRAGAGTRLVAHGGGPRILLLPGLRVGGLTLALIFPALPTSAQTVERRFEPFATGAATTIYLDEVALGATDLLDLLKWYVPGVVVLPPDSMWGDGKVILRGAVGLSNAPPNPLLIIDGVKISADNFYWRLRTLNPFQVESMTVVRDVASAAVYGGRAAGGVILVFTRRR